MSAAGLRVELISRRSDIPLGAEQWNALVAANETNTVFQTYEWFDSWWQVFGKSRELFFLVVREGDEVIGFAPLLRRRSVYGWRLLEFAGVGNSDYQDFVLPKDKPRAMAAICAFLRDHWWKWDRLALANVPGQSSSVALLERAARDSGLHLIDEIHVPCPALNFEADPELARDLIGRYSLRRPLNWFRKHGNVTFRHVSSAEEVDRLLPQFFDQHRARWANVGKPSLFANALQQRFYELLARKLHTRGWLQFSVVELDGAPIAFHYGFDYAGCVTWYKPAFAVRYAGHSPGLLLTRQLIEDCLLRSRRELDFTIGDEAFKSRFASVCRFNVYLGVYHGSISFGFAIGVTRLRQLASRVLRRLRLLAPRPEPVARMSVPPGGGAA
jgi:CelD/BcsL family acetyltransferase involved in cellulose biosynthesis